MYGMQAVTYQTAGMLDSAVATNKLALKYLDEDTAPDSLKNWPLYLNVSGLYSDLGNQHLAIEYTTNTWMNMRSPKKIPAASFPPMTYNELI